MKPHNADAQFGDLYATCADSVFRYLHIRTSNREVALDLTQDAFMRYWDALLKERDIQNHRAFLFVIAKNLVIDWYRKKKSVSLEALAERDPAARGPDDISLFFLGKERGVNADYASAEARHLAEKIKELDSIYQEVVYLRLVEELLPREISVVLGLSVNVISVRVNRGIKKLRILAGYDTKDERKGTSERNRIAAKRKNDARRKTPSL